MIKEIITMILSVLLLVITDIVRGGLTKANASNPSMTTLVFCLVGLMGIIIPIFLLVSPTKKKVKR